MASCSDKWPGQRWGGRCGVGPGTDTTALHVDVAGEIAGIAVKAVPVAADLMVIEDSADGNAKKSIALSTLPTSVTLYSDDGTLASNRVVETSGLLLTLRDTTNNHKFQVGGEFTHSERFACVGNNAASSSFAAYRYSNSSFGPKMITAHARGTEGVPVALSSGDMLGRVVGLGFDGTTFPDGTEMRGVTTEAWTGIARGCEYQFYTIPNGTLSQVLAMTIGQDGEVTIPGKLTVGGLIDPTGLVLTEQATDPGSTGPGEGTVWIRNDTPNVLVFTDDAGADHDILGDVVGPASSNNNAIARFDGTTGNLLKDSPNGTLTDAGELSGLTKLNVDNLEIDGNTIQATNPDGGVALIPDGTGRISLIGNTVTAGNIKNQGTGQFETKHETVLYSAGYVVQSADHDATTGKTSGRVDVYLGESENDTIVAGSYTPGVASTSNPTAVTIGSNTFAANHFVLIKDSTDNEGVFEVVSHVGTLLTVRGVGTVARVEDFTRDQFVSDDSGGTIRRVNVSVHRTSLTGTPEHGKGNATPITFNQLAHADDVPIVVNEFFAATDARFFGELGLPAAQGWTDTVTGVATIDLVDETVFGETKQVVRHNDNTAGGSTTSLIALTAQNWLDVQAFGASYGGTSRLDSVDGFNGFFSGMQANAAENPEATGNRRYGILFNDNGGFLRVDSPDVSAPTTFDGTGGNPLIPFDQYFKWECVIPAGLGAAQFFVNGILTTHTVSFINNTGGLGTRVLVGSGSTGGIDRITYHDNFGSTIYEEAATRTLAVATMAADISKVFVPPGKRDYTVTLPDGNPRGLGSLLELVMQNVGGQVTLTTQVPATPESLFDGLRTLVVDVPRVQGVMATNTVANSNVYTLAVPPPLPISGAWSDPNAQKPTVTTPVVVLFSSIDISQEGIAHSDSALTGEFTALIKDRFFWMFVPQWERTTSGGTRIIEFWAELDEGSGFVRIPKSAILVRATSNDSGLASLNIISVDGTPGIDMNIGDRIRFMMRVSTTTDGLGLFSSPDDGTRPEVPAAILTCVRGR